MSLHQRRALLTVLEGSASVRTETATDVVQTNETLHIAAGRFAEKRHQAIDELIESTRWVHEILMLKGATIASCRSASIACWRDGRREAGGVHTAGDPRDGRGRACCADALPSGRACREPRQDAA
jgi:hypothetical protein